jgi:hypothetical protein
LETAGKYNPSNYDPMYEEFRNSFDNLVITPHPQLNFFKCGYRCICSDETALYFMQKFPNIKKLILEID